MISDVTPGFYYIEEDPRNPLHRSYHSRMRLLDEGFQIVGGNKGSRYIAEGVEIPGLLDTVLDIPGVAHAQVTAYQLDILRSPMYAWDEIDQDMVRLWLGIPTAILATEPGTLHGFKIEAVNAGTWTRADQHLTTTVDPAKIGEWKEELEADYRRASAQ